jgi:hypothetical protein
MRVVRELRGAGIGPPERQHVVRDAMGRFLAQVDLAYPPVRVAIEVQSFRWHANPRGFARDRTRANRVQAAGWRFFEVVPGDAGGLAVVVDAVRNGLSVQKGA